MPETWFISDTHFGHKNILEYEKDARPFANIEEMNEAIIDRWNSTISHKDLVYHLGDFCFGKYNLILAERLKGRKKLIMGNHDMYSSNDYLLYFEKLYGCYQWEGCILSHIPVHPSQLTERWKLNIHGHLHSKKIWDYLGLPMQWVEDSYYFNVSCEQNNLTPINADIIREVIKGLS